MELVIIFITITLALTFLAGCGLLVWGVVLVSEEFNNRRTEVKYELVIGSYPLL